MRLTYYFIIVLIFLLVDFRPVFGQNEKSNNQKTEFKKIIPVAGVSLLIMGTSFFFDETVEAELRRASFTRQHYVRLGDFTKSYYQLGIPFITGGLSAVFKNRKLGEVSFKAGVSAIAAFSLTSNAKNISGRVRPRSDLDPFDFRGLNFNKYTSFVSGHSSVAFALAAVYSRQYKYYHFLPPLLYTSASIIAISRVAAGEHWLSDVTGGAAIGLTTGLLVNYFMERNGISIFPSVTPQGQTQIGFQYLF